MSSNKKDDQDPAKILENLVSFGVQFQDDGRPDIMKYIRNTYPGAMGPPSRRPSLAVIQGGRSHLSVAAVSVFPKKEVEADPPNPNPDGFESSVRRIDLYIDINDTSGY